MALLPRKALLEALNPLVQCKRFRGKVNVQRPKPAHFVKATYLALAKPWFLSQKKDKTPIDLCKFVENQDVKKDEYNPLQQIYAKEIYKRLSTSKLVVFYHHNSIKADESFKYYALFKKQGMELKRYGKKLLTASVEGTPYETILDFYITNNNMMLFCPEPEISKVLKITKKCPQLVLLAGILENTLINKDDLVKYSKLANLQTAQAELVQTINRVGSQLVSNLNVHQTTLVSHLEQRMTQLEDTNK